MAEIWSNAAKHKIELSTLYGYFWRESTDLVTPRTDLALDGAEVVFKTILNVYHDEIIKHSLMGIQSRCRGKRSGRLQHSTKERSATVEATFLSA